MRLLGYSLKTVLLLSILLFTSLSFGDSHTVRTQKDSSGKISSFDTAVVSLINKDIHVDLIGAVHLADERYYDTLNDLFKGYDYVLYELIAPEGHVATLGEAQKSGISEAARSNPGMAGIALSQMMLTNTLQFEYQLQGVDYRAKNFVHADFTPQEFLESMEDRGESFASILTSLLSASMAQQTSDPNGAKASSLRLLLSMISKNRVSNLRRSLAAELVKMEHLLTSLSGPNGSVIVTERNQKALSVFDKVVQKGSKKIAIFYGAAHLPDLITRLQKKEFVITDQKWMTAWDLAS